MEEVWKDVKGYEGTYIISNKGKVVNICTGHIMQPKKNNRDYVQIRLNKNGCTQHWLLHRLVAVNFIDNPNQLPQINHKDENKDNNCADNLEWCDNTYNRHYGTGIQRMAEHHDYKKMALMRSKPVNQYTKDGVFVKSWSSITAAALEITLKRSTGHISDCCSGKRLYAYDYIWKYKDVV